MALAFTISKSLQGVRGSEGEGREVGEGESGDGVSEREKGTTNQYLAICWQIYKGLSMHAQMHICTHSHLPMHPSTVDFDAT